MLVISPTSLLGALMSLFFNWPTATSFAQTEIFLIGFTNHRVTMIDIKNTIINVTKKEILAMSDRSRAYTNAS